MSTFRDVTPPPSPATKAERAKDSFTLSPNEIALRDRRAKAQTFEPFSTEEEDSALAFVPRALFVWGLPYYDLLQILQTLLQNPELKLKDTITSLKNAQNEADARDRRRQEKEGGERHRLSLEFGPVQWTQRLEPCAEFPGEFEWVSYPCLTFQQFQHYVELNELNETLPTGWRMQLIEIINESAPVHNLAMKIAETVRTAQDRRILYSGIKRKFNYVSEKHVEHALEFLVDMHILQRLEWKPDRGRHGLVYYME